MSPGRARRSLVLPALVRRALVRRALVLPALALGLAVPGLFSGGAAFAQTCGATLSLPDGLQQIPGQHLSVPIAVTDLTGLQVLSADVTLQYDPSVLGAPAVSAGSLTSGCTLTPNTTVAGSVVVSIFCVDELAGAGTLAAVDFTVGGAYTSSSALTLTAAQLNEGNPSACVDNGSFSVCGPELCDGLDNDCDLVVDNGFDVGAACTVGVGACAAPGVKVCDGGGTGTVCDGVPGSPTGPDTDCDGVDDDCDGTPDDGFVPQPHTCAPPLCGQAGARTCVGGAIIDSCTPGARLSLPDGVAGTPGSPVSIPVAATDLTGLGVLSSDLVIQYNPAVLQATSVALGPVAPASNCVLTPNLLTPGQVTLSIFCSQEMAGAGSLAVVTFQVLAAGGHSDLTIASAQLNEGTPGVCTDGGSVDACQAEICDGFDNDCDGSVDEGGNTLCDDSNQCTGDACEPSSGCVYTPLDLGTTSCGVGACQNTVPVCDNGVPQTCTPQPPLGPLDLTCDGIDGDCDGSTDEDFVPFTTHCGAAPCDRTGTATCVNGTLQDSCVAEAATVSLPASAVQSPGLTVVIPVEASDLTALGVVSADIQVGFTGTILQAQSVDAGSLAGGCTITPNLAIPDKVIISIFCTEPLSGAGSLAEITFLVTGATGTTSPLTLLNAMLNEGTPSVCPVDGAFSTCGAQEFCDGRDNDCDGTTDEGFNVGSTCVLGVGTCPLPAHVACTADGLGSVCTVDPSLFVSAPAPATADVQWTGIPGATFYDLVRGDLAALRSSGGNFTVSTGPCLANDAAVLSVVDSDMPGVGNGYFYLMRAAGCTGGDTYESGAASQVGTRDPEIAGAAGACP